MSYAAVGALPAAIAAKPTTGPVVQAQPPGELPWWAWPVGALLIGVVFTVVVHVRENR